jgi:hypothetical protein
MSRSHFRPFPVTVSDGRDSPPPDPDLSETFTSDELIVSGLRRTSLTCGTHVPPVTIVSPATQRPLNFLYLSLVGEFREQPRPDILDDLRQIVGTFDGVTALWKTAAGNTDKMLSFLADEFLTATQLKTRLEAIFTSHTHTVQAGYIPNNSDHIVFSFTKRESVLTSTPTTSSHRWSILHSHNSLLYSTPLWS